MVNSSRIEERKLFFFFVLATLRTDKMQLVSQVRKLEGRLIQIEKNHDNFQREVFEFCFIIKFYFVS